MVNHWLLPDDATKDEKDIFLYSVTDIYNQFNDPLDKLLIALVFELDYPQWFAAKILDRQEVTVSLRIKKIKTVLSRAYPHYLKS